MLILLSWIFVYENCAFKRKLRINWKPVRARIRESLGRTRNFIETIYPSIALTPSIIESPNHSDRSYCTKASRIREETRHVHTYIHDTYTCALVNKQQPKSIIFRHRNCTWMVLWTLQTFNNNQRDIHSFIIIIIFLKNGMENVQSLEWMIEPIFNSTFLKNIIEKVSLNTNIAFQNLFWNLL